MSALTPDEAKLVERLQGFVDACSGQDITLYEGHPAVLVAEAASAIIRIAEERREARAKAIEECATIAEMHDHQGVIAAAIRRLTP